MSGLDEIELMGIIETAAAMVRGMDPAPLEDRHVWWVFPVGPPASERDRELIEVGLSREFPLWSVEVHRVGGCEPMSFQVMERVL